MSPFGTTVREATSREDVLCEDPDQYHSVVCSSFTTHRSIFEAQDVIYSQLTSPNSELQIRTLKDRCYQANRDMLAILSLQSSHSRISSSSSSNAADSAQKYRAANFHMHSPRSSSGQVSCVFCYSIVIREMVLVEASREINTCSKNEREICSENQG